LKRLFLIAFVVAVSSRAQAEPAFQLDPTGKSVVLISNLYNDLHAPRGGSGERS
jgi:hypothetical protein